jgi:hypothetical protein
VAARESVNGGGRLINSSSRKFISISFILSALHRCPKTRGSNLECVFLGGNEGKKRLEKYSGCNSFLVMN